MKRIIITCGKLKIGGVQKSLISLLESINLDEYDVTLLLDNLGGELLKNIPDKIKIYQLPLRFNKIHNFKLDFESFVYLLKEPIFTLKNIKYLINNRGKKKFFQHLLYDEVKSKLTPIFNDKLFDTAISYAGGIGIWNQIVIDKINANKKIVWIHGNYRIFCTGTFLEKKYIQSFDEVVTVSNTTKDIIVKEIPQIRNRSLVIHNIINKSKILKYSSETVKDFEKTEKNFIRFVSVSRIDKEKGYDVAIRAFKKLVDNNFDVEWIIVGDGPERMELEKLAKKLKVNKYVKFVGMKSNPYPYFKNSSIFLHPSKGEGKSISVDEAKCFQLPILITDYPTVSDQIEDNITGKIVPFTEIGIYNGMVEMVTNKNLRNTLSKNLSQFDCTTTSLKRFYKITN